MKKIILAALMAAAVPVLAGADEIQLTNGRTLEGIVRKNKGGEVVVEVGSGRIVLKASDVSSIRKTRTALHEYYERWADVEGSAEASDFYALAVWAHEHNCHKFVVPLCERVVALEPDHAGAHGLMRHEKVDGKWLTYEEALAARGMVNVRGRWMTQAEAALREQKRLEALDRRLAREEERQRRQDEEKARREQRRREYEEWYAEASRSQFGYWYRPSIFWPRHFRPYPWVPYERAYRRSYYGEPYGGVPILNLQDFFSVPFPKFP